MKRKIVTTADGSKTIQIEGWNEQYHSMHGAVQEARHVFIQAGLLHITANPIHLLEIGFGTGLNALITLMEADKKGLQVFYTGVEAFPVTNEEVSLLNYSAQLHAQEYEEHYLRMHTAPWEIEEALTPFFTLCKQQKQFSEIAAENAYNLIYFDAFGARVQPELWTETIFQNMFKVLKENGVLVTYAAKGSVRRAMQAVGFTVERLPGPPGKREMLRATKKATAL